MNQPNYIAIGDIVANADQPRQTFIDDSLNELAASIKEHGIIQPLIVCENTNEATAYYPYALIAGERRLRAAQLAGLTEVPCLVRNVIPDAQTELELALIENIQREDLSAADEARAYERLRTEFHLTDEQIGQRVGKAASTIRGLRRLAELPIDVLALIGDGAGQLRVRDARRLIPISRLVKAEELVKAAGEIARLDADERKSIDTRLGRLIEKMSTLIDPTLVDFPSKPIVLAEPIAGKTEMTTCTSCEFYLKLSNGYGGSSLNCLNATCHTAKKRLFADSELKRVSQALGIPAVGPNEQASVLVLDHQSLDKVRRWVANPPKHLRVTLNGNPSRKDNYYHRDLTKSLVVFVASTQPHLLNDNPDAKTVSGKVVTGGVASSISVGTLSKSAIAKETADEKAARLQREEQARKEQEEADRKERLADAKARGLRRKAKVDSNWLVLHAAKALFQKVPLTGMWLEMFANHIEDEYVDFEDAGNRLDEIDDVLRKPIKAVEREALLREKVLLHLICDGAPDESDWPGIKKHLTEFITGKPGKNGAGGLGLKYTVPEPPVHHTDSNCYTCGAFAPFDEIRKQDSEDGWIVVLGGKDDTPTNIICPTCAKKSAVKPAPKPSAAKKATAKK